MSKRTVTLAKIPLLSPANEHRSDGKVFPDHVSDYFGTKHHFLVVELRYREGGANYSGTTENRGYEIGISPIFEETSKSGGKSTGFTLLAGVRFMVEPAKRFSEARLKKLAEIVPTDFAAKIEEIKAHVLAKGNLQIADATTTSDLYAALVAAGLQTDHNNLGSDLYVLDTPEAREIIKAHGRTATPFTSEIDHKVWLDLPFAYTPFWTAKTTTQEQREEAASSEWAVSCSGCNSVHTVVQKHEPHTCPNCGRQDTIEVTPGPAEVRA